MEKNNENVFSVPIYLSRYVGPSDTSPNGLEFGKLYGVRFGYSMDGRRFVKVLDTSPEIDIEYPTPLALKDEWELPGNLA